MMDQEIKSMEGSTIVAIATPAGSGGIGIVRLSGPEAEGILQKVFTPAGKTYPLPSHLLCYGKLHDGTEILDEGMAVVMRAPRSYTREDVAELQLHGGSWLLGRALELCLKQGAVLAQPGEFTKRAFLNGRIDLSRAEAVMSLISARGAQQHQAAIRQLEGGATAFAKQASEELYAISAGLAACIDYPEEVSDEEGAANLIPRLEHLIAFLKQSVDERAARLLQDGLQVALVGRPNVGKSSLLNALLGEERAIVTPIAGTTRDTVQGEMMLDGIRVVLTDTAGLRETEDPVEKIGVERSRRALNGADLVLLILDSSEVLSEEDRQLMTQLPKDGVLVLNKADLPRKAVLDQTSREAESGLYAGHRCFACSALQPESLKELKECLRQAVAMSDRMVLTQPRHLDAVRRAILNLQAALDTVQNLTPDMATTDLLYAAQALAEITGEQADERLLDEVFSRFCVGK